MNLTIKNNASGIRSYLSGLVTVADGGQTAIPRDINVIITSDAQFIYDVLNSVVILNNGAVDLNPGASLDLFKLLGQFSSDRLATLALYYSLPVGISQSAGTAAGTTVWSVRNPVLSSYSFVIESIDLSVMFDAGTPLAAKTLIYELLTFKTATPTGGTPIIPNKMSKIAPTYPLDARYLDTGLTVTNVEFDSTMALLAVPAVKGAVSRYEKSTCLKLAPGEGLAIRLYGVAATVGQGIVGEIVGSLR